MFVLKYNKLKYFAATKKSILQTKVNIFGCYRSWQKSHHNLFNMFFHSNYVKIIIPSKSYRNRNISPINCNSIFFQIHAAPSCILTLS